MSTIHQKQVAKYFSKKAIWYNPGLAIVLGSPGQGILISQLLFWHGKGHDKDGWIFKTISEMWQETGLTRTQQATAIRKCIDMQILEVKLKGIPAKRHFRLDLDKLLDLLPSLKKTCKLSYPNPPRNTNQSQQTITKSTQETTTKNTHHRSSDDVSSISDILSRKESRF